MSIADERKRRLLVADDEEHICHTIREIFETKGYVVTVAYEGEQARRCLCEQSFDVALLDENMPGLTGLELVTYIKQNGLRTKTIILSGYADLDADLVRRSGADGYLLKPVAVEEIEAVIEKVLAA